MRMKRGWLEPIPTLGRAKWRANKKDKLERKDCVINSREIRAK